MPHVQIEYSANLEDGIDVGGLCEAIRARASLIDAIPMPGLRVRAVRVDHYAIADGDAKHGFVDICVRMREGRTDAVKQDVINQVFETAKAYLDQALATRSIALSAELRDINKDLSPKYGTIRDHLGDSA